MRKSVIFFITAILCLGQLKVHAQWMDWITLYEEGYDRVQISFKVNGCSSGSTPDIINSYWRFYNTFTRPSATVSGKVEYEKCSGGIASSGFQIRLEKPKTDGIHSSGDWFMGARRVIRVYDIKFYDYKATSTQSGQNTITTPKTYANANQTWSGVSANNSSNYNNSNSNLNSSSNLAQTENQEIERLIAQIEQKALQRQESYDRISNTITQVGDYLMAKMKREQIQDLKDQAEQQFERLQEYIRKSLGTLTVCSMCAGKGMETCMNCEGGGMENCASCQGEGISSCSTCFGVGKFGTLPCSTCRGDGKSKCIPCSGKGSTMCTICIGVGHSNCDVCLGTGQEFIYR